MHLSGMYILCLCSEVLSIVLLLSLKLQIKKQLLNFCQDAGVGWCNAEGRRGEWSLQWHSSTSDPTPDTGMQRGIARACVVPPLKILVEVTRSRSARSHALGSVTALLVPTPLGQEIQQHHLHQVMQRMACPWFWEQSWGYKVWAGYEVIRYKLDLSYLCKSG